MAAPHVDCCQITDFQCQAWFIHFTSYFKANVIEKKLSDLHRSSLLHPSCLTLTLHHRVSFALKTFVAILDGI